MITSIKELAAVNAVMNEDLRAVCAAKIARLSGARPAAAPQPLPVAPLREFVAIVTPEGEPAIERTSWASCSMGALIDNLELLAREGVARVRVEVRAL